MSACCKPRVQLFVNGAMDGRIVRCGIISSCQSAATSELVKALLVFSASHVRSAIASTGLCLLPSPWTRSSGAVPLTSFTILFWPHSV